MMLAFLFVNAMESSASKPDPDDASASASITADERRPPLMLVN